MPARENPLWCEHALRLLGNCSSPAVYEYSTTDVNKIFHAIKDATADAENRFRKKGSGNRRFTLS